MKTLFFLLLSFSLTSAQNISEALKYYPLQNGNHWEYLIHFWNYGYPYYNDTTFLSVDITGDTILSNNKSYKILKQKNIPPNDPGYNIYERIDSVTACLYRFTNDTAFIEHEYLCDSLFAAVGDTFAGAYSCNPVPGYLFTIFENEYNEQVLGYSTIIKEFQDQSWIPAVSYSFAKDLGFIYSYACEGGCAEATLKYAIIDSITFGTPVLSIDDFSNVSSQNYMLYQNYPNPFNPSTNITYSIQQPGLITIKVYDLLGNEVATLVNEEKPAGRYNIKFDGRSIASGIYFYVLNAANFIQSRKMLLLK